MQKWLSVVGIGEDGLPGLSQVARSLVEQAEVLVGGDRHSTRLAERQVFGLESNGTCDAVVSGEAFCSIIIDG